jgi:hypothetical protein
MVTDTVEPEALALLGQLDTLLTKLAETDPTTLSGPQLLDFTRSWEQFHRRGAAVTNIAVAELDARHAAADTGHHSTAGLLSDLLRIDPWEARRRVKDAGEFGPRRGLTGEPLPPLLPEVSVARAAGQIGVGHARAISNLFHDLAHVDLDAETEQSVETNAVTVAGLCTPHQLRKWGVQVQSRLDPDGKEPSYEAKKRRRGVSLVDLPDGWAKLTGLLDPYAAAALRAVLGPLSAPNPAEDGTCDERTPSQRRHDGLADACTRLLRSGTLPDSSGAATTILVTIDYRDLLARYQHTTRDSTGQNGANADASATAANGTGATSSRHDTDGVCDPPGTVSDAATGDPPDTDPGTGDQADVGGQVPDPGGGATGYGITSYGTLIPVDQLLRRASDAKIIPVVLNDAGGVMAYGRARRLATPAQRRALAARDGGCVRPGCSVPADWAEVHHSRPWRDGGTTDIATQALVCPADHDALDRGASIVMIDGVPHWIDPPYLDPSQTPRRNTAHHLPRLLVPPREP